MATAVHLATNSGYYQYECQNGSWAQTERALTFWSLSCIAADPDQTGRLYVGTAHSGVFISDDGGRTWERPKPNVPHLGTASILVDADGVLVGTVPASLFRAHGDGWEELQAPRLAIGSSSFPPNPELGARTRCLAADPSHAGFLYAGIEVGGMLVSEDGGTTWEPANDGLTDPDVHEVSASRGTAGLVHAACGEEGLFRSTDRGAHWRLVNPEGPRGYGTAVTEDRDVRVYAGLARGRPNTWIRSEGADAAIVRSEDGGQTWQPVVEGLRGGVLDLCTAAEGDSVFAVTSDGDLLEVSLDGCRTVASRLPCISALTAA